LLLLLLFQQQTLSQRIYVDNLAEKYLTLEKKLWLNIEGKQLQVERGGLLNEIHGQHIQMLSEDFGRTDAIWSLGIQRHQDLFHNVLAINSNADNNKQYLTRREYQKVIELAKNTMVQMEKSATDFYNIVHDKKLWDDILNNIANGKCKKQGSELINSYQLIFDVHQEVSAVLLKNYINIQLAYMILKVTEEGAFKQKSDDYRKIFLERYSFIQGNTKSLLEKATKRKWTCDKNNLPATYFQITRFIQGYVDNEINLNPDQSCTQTCSDYSRTQSYGCHRDTLCGQTHIDPVTSRCNGTIYNCDFVGEDLAACASTQKPDTRRYEFIRYVKGKTLGKYDACLQTAQVESWTRWFVQCSNCFCYCDEQSHLSDRFFSLHDVTSNIADNRIVTGISITKRNRMIQFIIAESTLLPYGKVTVSPANPNIADSNANSNFRFVAHEEFDINEAGIQNGIDYHTLTYDHRTIDLDTVIAPPDSLVTGVRFHVTNDKRLTLQIRATKFNYETGKLEKLDESVWISSATNQKTKLDVKRPDAPIRQPNPSEPDWRSNLYVEFGPTDRDKDAAQLTVPFLDGSFVEGQQTLLSGIGLYFKGQPGYGGFIAPSLVVYDFVPLLKPLLA